MEEEDVITITIDRSGKILRVNGVVFDPQLEPPADGDYLFLDVSLTVTKGLVPGCPPGKRRVCDDSTGELICICR
jgi:hypothetical protein